MLDTCMETIIKLTVSNDGDVETGGENTVLPVLISAPPILGIG